MVLPHSYYGSLAQWESDRLSSGRPRVQSSHDPPNEGAGMKATIEIRPGEGGQDARLLCDTQGEIYMRYLQTRSAEAKAEATAAG